MQEKVEPVLSPLRNELLIHHQRIVEANNKLHRVNARKVYNNVWVTNTEKELDNCVIWLKY